jgi:hypothetical protein
LKINGDKKLVLDMSGAISFDLKETYNHIPVHPTLQGLLGIQYMGNTRTYRGVHFGLNDAPREFTQIMNV